MSIDAPPRQSTSSAFDGERPSFPVTRPDYTKPDESASRRRRIGTLKQLGVGLSFLAPNIMGFLAFTAVPLVFSMVLAFSNWDLTLHNQFKEEASIRFVGLDNFTLLLQQSKFYKFLGNTLFFMMGMPFAIAASLIAAILLSKDLKGGSTKVWLGLMAGAVLVASVLMLVAAGAQTTGMMMLISGLVGGVLIAGVLGRTTIYRTLFYVPHFTAGVATYLLWKKLYNPTSGPITVALTPPLDWLSTVVNRFPTPIGLITWVCIALMLAITFMSLRRLRDYLEGGDVGVAATAMSVAVVLLPAVLAWGWLENLSIGGSALQFRHIIVIGAVGILIWHAFQIAGMEKGFIKPGMLGVGTGLMFAMAMMVAQLVLVGLAAVFFHLPVWAQDGLETPKWLSDTSWAKPSLMIMGFWGAIGSNTMLLYLAALTNVPQELYEAADIDGASRFQKFWNVTWPQLAPTTFFIVVMGVIGGLQGGFEMARVMTQGGPAGQTTTLAYFIYTEGFETGRLGYSSAVAWTLFLMVLIMTLFNWKFGNKYVND